jgi:hypothetical protein
MPGGYVVGGRHLLACSRLYYAGSVVQRAVSIESPANYYIMPVNRGSEGNIASVFRFEELMIISCFPNSSTRKMEQICSETSLNFHQTTQPYMPEDEFSK